MKKIYPLETGYRTTIGGVLWTTDDNRILWATGGPIFPQIGLFHLYRAELRESADNGITWSEPRTLFRSTREYAWIPNAGTKLASGRLILISGQFGGYVDHDPDKSRMEGYSQYSDDHGRTWSEAKKLPTGQRYLAPPLSMTQMSCGRVIFPYGYLTKEHARSLVTVVFSDNEGQTWQRSVSILGVGGKGMESGALEPSVIELPDGKLWMLIRAQTGFQWESFSCDKGETWTTPQPSRIPSSNSPAVVTKLSNGTILLTWNNCVTGVYARPSLMMAATHDGKNFYGFREIAHTGYPMVSTANQWGAMYPFLTEAPDGKILVAFNYGDWTYLQAKVARIDPAWLEEKAVNYDFAKNGLGDWCTIGVADPAACLTPVPDDNECGAAIQITHKDGLAGAVHDFPLLTEGQVRLSLTVNQPQAVLLWHNTFPYPGKTEDACLRIRFAEDGATLLGAGTPQTKEERHSNLDQNPIYSYLAYPIEKEIPYPQKFTAGKPLEVTLQCSLAQRRAAVSINKGPEVVLPLPDILGLCYFALAGTNGGSIKLSKIIWNSG
jgi:hypothetical protein